MPAGTRIQETGDAEIMGEVFAGFATAMGTGLMLVLVVLILLFGSVFHSITILGSLPLAIGGVVAGLYFTNNAISMPVVIGILMLMGIVTKNAIMLVDFAIEEVKHGIPRAEAIIDAGRKRARPIVMTTIAMSAGMVPAAMALGDGGEFRAPMAIAVIGGLHGVDLPVAGLRAVLLHDHGRHLDPGGQGVPLAGQAQCGRRAGRRGAFGEPACAAGTHGIAADRRGVGRFLPSPLVGEGGSMPERSEGTEADETHRPARAPSGMKMLGGVFRQNRIFGQNTISLN